MGATEIYSSTAAVYQVSDEIAKVELSVKLTEPSNQQLEGLSQESPGQGGPNCLKPSRRWKEADKASKREYQTGQGLRGYDRDGYRANGFTGQNMQNWGDARFKVMLHVGRKNQEGQVRANHSRRRASRVPSGAERGSVPGRTGNILKDVNQDGGIFSRRRLSSDAGATQVP